MREERVVAPHFCVLRKAMQDGQYPGGIVRPPQGILRVSPQPICIVLRHDSLCVATTGAFRNEHHRRKNLISQSLTCAHSAAFFRSFSYVARVARRRPSLVT